MSNFIGPALPLHLQRKMESDESNKIFKADINQTEHPKDRDTDSCESVIGPTLPPQLVQSINHPLSYVSDFTENKNVPTLEIGPSLPNTKHTNIPSSPESDGTSIGPALPSHLRKQASKIKSSPDLESSHEIDVPLPKETEEDDDNSVLSLHADVSDEENYGEDSREEMYGPALPPSLRVGSSKSTEGNLQAQAIVGPCLPPGIKLTESSDHGSSDSDTDVVGPMPIPEGVDSATYLQNQFDDRALRMKRKLAGEDDSRDAGPMKRESWMLELPPDRAAEFGLGPRQFRARAKPEPGDRSIWTDTPADRLRKKDSVAEKSDAVDELELKDIGQRNKEMQKLVEKHSGKKRKESLLESHQKKLKKKLKKEKEEGKLEERRPFDRNIDLQANRFDEAQKKSIFKKAQLLNDRFSSGQSKFL